MPLRICPHCNQRFVMENYTSDLMHQCNSGSTTLDNEDHFNITASPLVGMTNKLFGTRSSIQNNTRLQSKTSRGNHVLTHNTRQRNVYLDYTANTLGRNPTS